MTITALRRGTQDEGNTDYFTGCPIGGGFLWFGLPTKIPSNCRICDNSTLAIASFAKLYENLGGAWGESGGSMNIPDLRGRFPRGVDGGAGRDPGDRTAQNTGGNSGDAVGSVQGDDYKSHGHTSTSTSAGAVGYASGPNPTMKPGTDAVSSSGGNETRPKNANVYFVIRVS